jgi:hypothetical protein
MWASDMDMEDRRDDLGNGLIPHSKGLTKMSKRIHSFIS